MPVSGAEPSTPETPAPPATPAAVPAGHVTISQAEHDRLFAENRRLEAKDSKRTRDDAAAAAQSAQDAAVARGAFDEALAAEKVRTTAAETRGDRLAAGDTLRDEIAARGFDSEAARILCNLVNLDQVVITNGTPERASLVAAVDGVVAQYPDLFKSKPADPDPTPAPGTPPRASAPAVPVAEGGQQPGVGYLSPEEYLATDPRVRITDPKFMARVEASRHRWPDTVSATLFEQG